MRNENFRDTSIASEAGKKSKRSKGVKTLLTEYLLERANRTKNGEAPVTMEDLKSNSPAVWLWLRENAENWQEVLLCESHLSKYLHTAKVQVEVNTIADLVKKSNGESDQSND